MATSTVYQLRIITVTPGEVQTAPTATPLHPVLGTEVQFVDPKSQVDTVRLEMCVRE